MAHYAFICPDDAGHLLSVSPFGVELMRRGHRVTMVTGAKAVSIARQLNLPWHELKADGIRRPLLGPMWLAFTFGGSGWMIALRNWFHWRSLGKWNDRKASLRGRLGMPPENVLVVDFAPQLALLDKAHLLITHRSIDSQPLPLQQPTEGPGRSARGFYVAAPRHRIHGRASP